MKGNQTIDVSILTDTYQTLLTHLRRRWLIILIVAFPNFILIPFLFDKIFRIHVFTSLLFVALAGIWCNLLSQIFSLASFLYPKIKNFTGLVIKNNSFGDFLICFWKNLKRRMILFSATSSSFLFWIFLVLWQQPEEDGTSRVIELGDVVGVLFMCFFVSVAAFLISSLIINHFLKIKSKRKHNTLSTLEDFQEFQSSYDPPTSDPFYSAEKMWKDWDHDPMNPASAEYQSTYRPWNHDV